MTCTLRIIAEIAARGNVRWAFRPLAGGDRVGPTLLRVGSSAVAAGDGGVRVVRPHVGSDDATPPHRRRDRWRQILAVIRSIDRGQAVVERHTMSSADGRCLTCGVLGPCPDQERAARVFALVLRLPRRVPWLTQPHLVGVPRADTPSWFEATG